MSKRPCLLLLFGWVCALGLGAAEGSAFAGARDEASGGKLLSLVGADAGLCLEVKDLNDRIPQFARSALFERVEKLPMYLAWKQSPKFQKLADVGRHIRNQTGQPLGEFAMSLFGRQVIFAAYPREVGKPAGVLLLKASSGEALQAALSVWNHDERVKLEPVSFPQARYFRRTEFKGKNLRPGRPQFYFVRGETFAISDEEEAIRDVIRRSLNPSQHSALGESGNYRVAQKSLAADCWATLYFDPRAWKTGWTTGEGRSESEKLAAAIWNRCRAAAVGLRAGDGLAVDVVLHYDPAAMPERWGQWVSRTGGFPQFLNQVPARALVVFAGKQDLAGVDRLAAAELDEPNRQQWQNARQVMRGFLLGLDLFDDVLPKFRPNWGFYLVPREPLDKDALPVEALFAIQLPPVPADKDPITIRRALENALNTSFNLLAAMQISKTPAVVKSKPEAGGDVHWLESLGPYRPAYSVSSDYLIFASSPQTIAEFLSPAEPKLAAGALFHVWSRQEHPPEGQVLFASWQAIREFISQHHDFLLEQAVLSHALPREEAEKRLKRLSDVLQIFDGVYLGIQFQTDQIRITAGGLTADGDEKETGQ